MKVVVSKPARNHRAACALACFALACSPAPAQNQLPPGTTAPDSTAAGHPAAAGSTLAPAAAGREAAETKIEQHDYPAATALLEKHLRQHPTDARALFDLAYIQDATNDPAAAATYRKAIAADPKQFESRLALGLLLAHQSKFEEAREQLRQATQLTPDPPNPATQAEAWRTLARLDRASDPPAARDALVAALKLTPETQADLLLTAQIAEANNDLDLAQTAYGRVLAEHPTPGLAAEANTGLAELLIKQKNYAAAEPLLKSALERDPRDPAVNAQLATTLLAQGKTEAALPVLELLQQLEPGNASVDQMLADAYSQANQPAKADPLYERLARTHPNDEDVLAGQGENYLREKLYPQAQAALEKAVKQKPDDGDAWSGLAFASSQNKQYNVTLNALSMRAKLMGETPVSYFLWATSYDNLHMSKPAQNYYHKFLAVADGKYPDQEWQAKHRLVALGGSH